MHGTAINGFKHLGTQKAQALDIFCKELIPIILASATWGHKWAGHQVVYHCDNQVVVAALRSRSSRQPHLIHLLRCMAFTEASLNFNMSATYISTRSNHLADDLSRDRVHTFLSKVPQASPMPSPISWGLIDLLLNPEADWVCNHWRQSFHASFKTA